MEILCFKFGKGYRNPNGKKMQYKCYWYLQIGNHIMISANNVFKKLFWYQKWYTGQRGIWFGVRGLTFRFQRYPIEWPK